MKIYVIYCVSLFLISYLVMLRNVSIHCCIGWKVRGFLDPTAYALNSQVSLREQVDADMLMSNWIAKQPISRAIIVNAWQFI
jgi:hypothetical protein